MSFDTKANCFKNACLKKEEKVLGLGIVASGDAPQGAGFHRYEGGGEVGEEGQGTATEATVAVSSNLLITLCQ